MRRRVVLAIADGLRRDSVSPATMPRLAARLAGGTRFAQHHAVFPSVTRVSSACVATGCRPARHGLQGNTVALLETGDAGLPCATGRPGDTGRPVAAGRPGGGRLVRHDVGDHAFFAHWRAVTGATLRVPTLAERLAPQGGAVVYANASPGAALAHDPDGHGEVRHRAVGQGPGRVPLPPLPVGPDAAGDAAMTTLFLERTLASDAGPALAVLWLGGPDFAQHAAPLGSAEHVAGLRAADECLGRVFAAVEARRAAGEDVLLLCGSDHGHETVREVIDIEAELVAAGLKVALDSDDVVVAANGTAALVYLDPAAAAAGEGRRAVLGAFLAAQPWAGRVFGAADLAQLGHAPEHGLAFAVALRCDMAPNAEGVPGLAFAAKPAAGKPDRLGCGQHGGLGPHETAPVLLAEGDGFTPGAVVEAPTSLIDLAPTVLRHLGLPAEDCDGRPLQGTP